MVEALLRVAPCRERRLERRSPGYPPYASAICRARRGERANSVIGTVDPEPTPA